MSGEELLRAALERIVVVVNDGRGAIDTLEEVHAVARIALAAPPTPEPSGLRDAEQALIRAANAPSLRDPDRLAVPHFRDTEAIWTAIEAALRAAPSTEPALDAIQMPVQLIRSEWPPNPDLTPGGSDRFDAVYESLRRGEPVHTPITLRSDFTVIDGMHRLTAARLLGLRTIPVRVWTGHEWVPARLAESQP